MDADPRTLVLTSDEQIYLQKFDYIRLTVADIDGIARCKLLPKNRFHVLTAPEGMPLYSGSIATGTNCMKSPLDKLLANNNANGLIRAMPGTLRLLPWAGSGTHKIGVVLGETFWDEEGREGLPQEACTRYVARKQLMNLQQLGLSLKLGFEAEFIVYKADKQTPISSLAEPISFLMAAKHEKLIIELESGLRAAGIEMESIMTESGYGQLEFATMPLPGLEAADNMFLMKHSIKEMCQLRDLVATFMSKPDLDCGGNGMHLNHSLWSADGKINVMYDEHRKKKMSTLADHWVAGLVHHAPALAALCSPTVNCYRRLFQPWAPDRANWGLDNRFAVMRVKNKGPSGTYVENRLVSGAANPYIALAATVAAGISGIKSKMELPPERQGTEPLLPRSLEEALVALEKDKVMVQALGGEFVRWFTAIKRAAEIECLRGKDFEDERKIYLENL